MSLVLLFRHYTLVLAFSKGPDYGNLMQAGCNRNKINDFITSTKLNETCYITAELQKDEIPSPGLDFLIGDEDNYGSYQNVKLIPGFFYTVYIDLAILLQVSSSSC